MSLITAEFDTDFFVDQFGDTNFDQILYGETAAMCDKSYLTWRVNMAPKGAIDNGVEYRDHIGIFVELKSQTGCVNPVEGVLISLHVFKSDIKSLKTILKPKLHDFNVGKRIGVAAALIQGAALKPYLINMGGQSCLRVRCKISVRTSEFDPQLMLEDDQEPPAMDDVVDRLERWASGGRGMVTVVAEGDGAEFHEYRQMLADSSEVFAAMFAESNGGFREGTDRRVVVNGIDQHALKLILKYMRSGTLPDTQINTHLVEVLAGANQYCIEALKSRCHRLIVEEMCDAETLPGRFLDLLAAADKFELDVAQNVALSQLRFVWAQLTDEEERRFYSDEFKEMRKRFRKLVMRCANGFVYGY